MLTKKTRAEQPESPANGPRREGSLRWRRFGAMMLVSGAITGGLVVATAKGALAAQFSISGLPFTVTATQLQGTGFEQFGTLDRMVANSPNAGKTGGQVFVIVSEIGSATLTNLCQSVALGGGYLKITAGSGSNPVSADTLIVDSTQVGGDASFSNMSIGQDASTLTEVPNEAGPAGDFGQQADKVTINNLRQTNYATTAASFTLPGLSMSISATGC